MSKGSGKAVNLRDKLDGNELDLSLSDLTEVPVKDLACLPKATVLDLSCNNLRVLPSEFCSLTHLVKLDLSKNQLVQLPPEFGRLVNLQHVDLYNNKLVVLPVSFAQLKNLRWLDLKDNPLEATLAKVAGDCLDEKQCRACASHVLQHMRILQSDLDREKQRRLQAEREQEKKREAEQRAREARERELRKKEKAEEKERKRREYDAQKAARASQEQRDANRKAEAEAEQQQPCAVSSAPKLQTSWRPFVLKLFLLILLAAAAMVAVCQLTELRRDEACVPINSLYADLVSALKRQEVVSRILQKLSPQQP